MGVLMNETKVQARRAVAFQAEWQKIVDYAAKGLKMDEEERRWLADSPVARYIAAIPYAAGCRNPDRMALSMLTLFVVEIRGGSPFDTRPEDMDGTLERIAPYFEPLYAAGGDREIVDKGKLVLGMKTFSHWIEETDAHPSARDFVPLRYQLKVRVEGLPPNELLDSILSVDDGMINSWFRTEP
jgi:hypothetical protein